MFERWSIGYYRMTMKAMENVKSETYVGNVGNLQVTVRCWVHRIIERNQEEQRGNDLGMTGE